MNRAFWRVLATACLLLPAARAQSVPSPRVLFLVGGSYHHYEDAPKVLIQYLQARPRRPCKTRFRAERRSRTAAPSGQIRPAHAQTVPADRVGPEQKAGSLEAVRTGLPVGAPHCTFWCFRPWPEPLCPATPKTGRSASAPGSVAATAGVPSTCERPDEPYMVDERGPSMHVLVRTCMVSEGRSGPEPRCGPRRSTAARIFAMTFGHDLKAQRGPAYLALLANGVAWALER